MLSLEEIEALDIIMGGRTTINYGQSGSEMEKRDSIDVLIDKLEACYPVPLNQVRAKSQAEPQITPPDPRRFIILQNHQKRSNGFLPKVKKVREVVKDRVPTSVEGVKVFSHRHYKPE